MRVLMVGAGGVGDAAARIAAERSFFEQWVVADYDLTRADRTVASVVDRHPGETRFRAAQVDASDAHAVADLARLVGATTPPPLPSPARTSPPSRTSSRAASASPRSRDCSRKPSTPIRHCAPKTSMPCSPVRHSSQDNWPAQGPGRSRS